MTTLRILSISSGFSGGGGGGSALLDRVQITFKGNEAAKAEQIVNEKCSPTELQQSATSKPSARLPLTKRFPNCSQLCAFLPRHMKQFIRKKCLYLLAQSWECRWGYTTVSHRRGQAPTRAEVRCVVAPSCSLLPFVVKAATLASSHPFPFGSHLQLCLSCNPNLLSLFHASHYRTTFHQNLFLINTHWIWSRLGEEAQLIWVGGGSIFVVFFLVRNVPGSCEA